MIQMMKKEYLYQRIINYININPNKIELLKYKKGDEQKIFDEIEKLSKNYDINSETNYDTLEGKKQYFKKIIEFFKKENESLKVRHLNILNNLLFSDKDLNFSEVYDNNIFTLNDFILTYTLKVIRELYDTAFNKNKSIKLKNIYLYLIFQIRNEDCPAKLEYLTYNYFYGDKIMNNDIENFITESSKSIVSKENFNFITLKDLKIKFNEIDNFNNNKVPDNVKTFFKGNNNNIKEKEFNDLLNFFNKKNIKNNFNKTNLNEIQSEDIVIDELDFNNNKLHLFSPEFLIVNGLKTKIEYCDIEIFNSDNYSVETFSKFIKEIINEINKSINENNFSNDFMKNNLIQLHQLDKYIHYISAKLDYNNKIKLNNIKKKEDIKIEEIIKINVKDKDTNVQKDDQDILVVEIDVEVVGFAHAKNIEEKFFCKNDDNTNVPEASGNTNNIVYKSII